MTSATALEPAAAAPEWPTRPRPLPDGKHSVHPYYADKPEDYTMDVEIADGGKKVALCDQLEDPALAKGIVKRSVTAIAEAASKTGLPRQGTTHRIWNKRSGTTKQKRKEKEP